MKKTVKKYPDFGTHTQAKILISAVLIIFSLLILIIYVYRGNSYFKSSAGHPKKLNVANHSLETIKQKTYQAHKEATKSAITIPPSYGRTVYVPILTYHYIGNNPNPADKARDYLSVAPDKFDEQMSYLSKNGYNAIILDSLDAGLMGKITLPPKPVVLTFDDGYIDFYLNAFPILKKYNLHAVSFIPTGLMGQGYYLSWAQIKQMDASGLISFEAHSVNHPNLTALTPDQVKYQITESKKVLEAQLGKPVNFFAYPYGASNEQIWQAVKSAGYVGALGTWYGITLSEGNILDWPRIKIPGNISTLDFAKKL